MVNGKNYKSTVIQLFYFGLIGIISNVSSYLIFLLVTSYRIGPKLAMTGLYIFCALISYFCNWRLTFKGSGSFKTTGFRFVCAHFLGYLINFLLLLVFVDYLDYPYYAIEAIAIIVVAGCLFLAFKFFVFTSAEKTQQTLN
jgi:putative flippase GtrA